MEHIKNEEEEKNLRRTMESGKVMFEVVNVNENVPDDEHPDEDDDIAFRREDISGKKSSLILRRIPRKLSKQRLGDVGQYDRETQKEIEARRKTLFASRSDLSRVSSVFLAETKSRQSRGSNVKSIGMSGRGSSRILFSDNIPVRSMTLEMPRRTALPEEEAAVYCDILEKSLDQLGLIRYRIPAEVDDRWDEGDRNCCEKYDVPAEPEYNLREYLGLRTLIPSVSEKLQRDRYRISQRKSSGICNYFIHPLSQDLYL
uniref:Srb8 protein n=1 Tax=Fopius arisanus TaxID=64838 RepID=A0A0C9Q027_9HYME